MKQITLSLCALLSAGSAYAAQGQATGGPAAATVTMNMTLGDSITLSVTGDITGNTTLALVDDTLDFGNVYYGALGPLGTAGQAFQNLVEENEYAIARLSLQVEVSGLLSGADMTASEGAGATYSDPANITAVVTNVGNITTLWAVDGTTGVNDLQLNPALGQLLHLVPQSLEAGYRIDRLATPGASSVPFVFTATPI